MDMDVTYLLGVGELEALAPVFGALEGAALGQVISHHRTCLNLGSCRWVGADKGTRRLAGVSVDRITSHPTQVRAVDKALDL